MHNNYLFQADNFGFRPIYDEDLDYLIQLDTDPEVRKFFPTGTLTIHQIKNKIKNYQKNLLEKGYGIFLVFELNTGEFVGRAGFGDVESGETEVGYLILKKYWNKGYATRILKILLSWAKDNIHKDKIIAFTPVAHIASERVMQKAGMVFTKKEVIQNAECVMYEYKL